MPPVRTIAIIAANPALSSILTATLASDPGLRVREFDSEAALSAYMRIAPVDLLVCDFDRAGPPAARFVAALRADMRTAHPGFGAIALARRVTPGMREDSRAAGIDEVIAKPMSPRHLHQRVRARLAPRRPAPAPLRRPHPRALGGNVVELFPRQPA